MNFLPLIEGKRDGRPLAPAEIREVIADYTRGRIPDYQMAAFLMAVYFRGLNDEETATLTLAMRDSGTALRFPADPRPIVDKHSTGGVGDKVSLPLAPLLACLGFRVPMISGRGLGITGGTLDKLDSIPGFRTLLPVPQIIETVQHIGGVICGQTADMVPADRALYALRDATATVPCIPLIVASILSKKLAEGLNALILDVKFGAAAFMPTLEKARELAEAMVTLGNRCGVNTRAVLTRMDVPLGRAAGNWLEVKESVECLDPQPGAGRITLPINDLRDLVLDCAAHLLLQTGSIGGRTALSECAAFDAARKQAENCLTSGAPRKKWDEMLAAQGADLEALNRKLALDHTAPAVIELKADKSGFVSRCDARLVGEVVRHLGGGRFTKESAVNYDVGLDRIIKPGEKIAAGEPLARVHAADASSARSACEQLNSAFEIADQPPALPPLIAGIIERV